MGVTIVTDCVTSVTAGVTQEVMTTEMSSSCPSSVEEDHQPLVAGRILSHHHDTAAAADTGAGAGAGPAAAGNGAATGSQFASATTYLAQPTPRKHHSSPFADAAAACGGCGVDVGNDDVAAAAGGVGGVDDPAHMGFCERLRATGRLWPYMLPLFIVYFAEYAMQSGTWTAIGEQQGGGVGSGWGGGGEENWGPREGRGIVQERQEDGEERHGEG